MTRARGRLLTRRGPEDPRPRVPACNLARTRAARAGASSLRSCREGRLSPDPRRLERAIARRPSESSRLTMHRRFRDPERRRYALCREGALRHRRRPAAAETSPLPSASPASAAAASPRTAIRPQALLSRVGERSAKPSTMVRRAWGRRSRPEQDRPTLVDMKTLALCGQPAGPFRPTVPRFAVVGQDGRLTPARRDRGPWRRSLKGRSCASDASCQHGSPRFRDA